MNVFFEPIDLNQWNLFEEVSCKGHVEPFLATKKMSCGDLLLLHIGMQNPDYESGVYAYGTIVKDPYVLEGRPLDYCNGKLSVDVRIDDIRYDAPIIDRAEVETFVSQFRSRHKLDARRYRTILKHCPAYQPPTAISAPGTRSSTESDQAERDILSILIPRVVIKKSAITYADLSDEIEKTFGRHYNVHFGFGSPLGRIQEVCLALELPCISSMVVNQKWELPSGFYTFYRKLHPEHASSTDQEIRKHEQNRCRECEGWDKLLSFYDINLKGTSLFKDAAIYVEGARNISVKITNEIERNHKARAACLRAQGSACKVCGFDSSEKYGVEGIIHVHHINPIGQSTGEHSVDPEKDLVPVCPNCHALIHSKPKGLYTVEEAKQLLEDAKAAKKE